MVDVTNLDGEPAVDKVMQLLRQYVFQHEALYASCHYLCVRGFDVYSNTPLEGTNSGLKECEIKVLPSMSQAQATKTHQDQNAFQNKSHMIAQWFLKHQLGATSELGQ